MSAKVVSTQPIGISYDQMKDNFIKDCERLVATNKAVVMIKVLTRNKSTGNCALQGLKHDHMLDLKLVVNGRINSTGMTEKISVLDRVFFSKVANTHDAIVLLFNKYKVFEIVINSPEWKTQQAYWKLIDDNQPKTEFKKELEELDKMTRSSKVDQQEEEEVEIILA